MSDESFAYIGSELNLFAAARTWKGYWRAHLRPYLSGTKILEVGAGMGATTRALLEDMSSKECWVGLEPDESLSRSLQKQQQQGKFPDYCEFRNGTIHSLHADEAFDAILYIDVLEHIQDDRDEVAQAAYHLTTNGYLIVLAPAYQFLYTDFDKHIGHYRRYTRSMLRQVTPPGCQIVAAFYLDSAGLLASLSNRLFLRASLPTIEQIRIWDTFLVASSKKLDPIVRYSFGRSIIMVWQRIGQ
jgi:ubiquinone/menaquinone biosynthesis C-methylase UbiE